MNKVLVTGLGVAKDLGLCEACDLNFSWLAGNPSTILWADQIYIPQDAYDVQISINDTKADKVINMFLQMAEQQGIIHRRDLSAMYEETVGEDIYKRMKEDSQALLETYPETVKRGSKEVPDEIIIENEGYCAAWRSSVYADIKVAQDLDANCLFSEREHTFLKYVYGLDSNKFVGGTINNIYTEIFSLYMPEEVAIHYYAIADEEKCKQCYRYELCKGTYLQETKSALNKMLKWREYDELQQAKNEIDKIIRAKNEISTKKDIDDIVKEFQEKQIKINRNIKKRFPKVKRWTTMTTVMASSIATTSAIIGDPSFAVTGVAAATAGAAFATEKLIEIYQSKKNWVGFVNDMKNGKI